MKVARVSKLNGLKSSVMGNSFIISTKHNIPPAIIDLETNGIVTFKIVFCSEFPSVLLAEKIFGDVLLNPEFTEPKPMALNLIIALLHVQKLEIDYISMMVTKGKLLYLIQNQKPLKM